MPIAATISASQEQVLVVGAFPAQDVNSSQFQIESVVQPSNVIDASQIGLFVIARGSNTDPSVRAWTFTLDGHNYYVLRLGTQETLVYDEHAGQWYTARTGMVVKVGRILTGVTSLLVTMVTGVFTFSTRPKTRTTLRSTVQKTLYLSVERSMVSYRSVVIKRFRVSVYRYRGRLVSRRIRLSLVWTCLFQTTEVLPTKTVGLSQSLPETSTLACTGVL